MAVVPASVPKAVPSATTGVTVLNEPQLGTRKFYQSGGGTERIPEVGRPVVEGEDKTPASPAMGTAGAVGRMPEGGAQGAPSVATDGFLFKRGPISPHYGEEYSPHNPYQKVNNPPTRGMLTFIKSFLNHIATSQDVDSTGFRERHGQQRTSWMRVTPPPHGIGYVPGFYEPRQMPQQPNTARTVKATGTQPYGTGVLNTDVFGAGQTAGGIGGSQYTPQPGPPATYSTSPGDSNPSGMPTWG